MAPQRIVISIARVRSFLGMAKMIATAGNILVMAPSAIAIPPRQSQPRSRHTKATMMSAATRSLLCDDCSERSAGNATSACATAHCSRGRRNLSAKKIASALTAFHKKSPTTNERSAKGAKSSANVGEYLK